MKDLSISDRPTSANMQWVPYLMEAREEEGVPETPEEKHSRKICREWCSDGGKVLLPDALAVVEGFKPK